MTGTYEQTSSHMHFCTNVPFLQAALEWLNLTVHWNKHSDKIIILVGMLDQIAPKQMFCCAFMVDFTVHGGHDISKQSQIRDLRWLFEQYHRVSGDLNAISNSRENHIRSVHLPVLSCTGRKNMKHKRLRRLQSTVIMGSFN